MQSDRHIWQGWAQKLHSWGVGEWTATVLESVGPLTWLGAQILYLGQPLFSQATRDNHVQALAKLLENPESAETFINMLRQDLSR